MTRASIIKERLEKAFSPLHLEVINESDQHVGHAGYLDGDRHFLIVISAKCFTQLPKIEAHRQIYALFDDMIPEQIHALKIKILPSLSQD